MRPLRRCDAEGLANGLEDGTGGDVVVIGCSGGSSSCSSSSSMVQDGGRVGATHVDKGQGGEIARLGLSGGVDEDEADEARGGGGAGMRRAMSLRT